jgi:CheY-like chemotaxis protein
VEALGRALVATERPWLVLLEHDPPRIDGVDTWGDIRQDQHANEWHPFAALMVSHREDAAADVANVMDWLIKPFSVAHARAKIRACLMRSACASKVRKDVSADAYAARIPEKQQADGKELRDVVDLQKAALIWMFNREIAPFESDSFGKKVGEVVVRAVQGLHGRQAKNDQPAKIRNREPVTRIPAQPVRRVRAGLKRSWPLTRSRAL